jgi:ribose transport system permease protein
MLAKKELGLLVLILVIGAITALLNPLFLSQLNIVNMANLVGLFGIFSIGEGLVIITGGIDLSVGSMFALLGVVLIWLLTDVGLAWPLALLAIIAGGLILGAIQGFLVTKARMQPFVVTLCGLLIYRGLARYLTADASMGFGYGDDFDTLANLASGRLYGIPHTLILLVIIAGIMMVVLHRSVFGRYLYAVGKNEEAARFSGIRTHAVIAGAYILCGGMAGITTVLLVFYTNSVVPSSFGNFYELYGIAAAVLGGCSLRGGEGSIIGIVLGTILLQVLQNLVNILGIPSSLNFAVMGTVILLGVLADQQLQIRRKLVQASAGSRVPAHAALPRRRGQET